MYDVLLCSLSGFLLLYAPTSWLRPPSERILPLLASLDDIRYSWGFPLGWQVGVFSKTHCLPDVRQKEIEHFPFEIGIWPNFDFAGRRIFLFLSGL